MAGILELQLATRLITAIERIAGAHEKLAIESKRSNDVAERIFAANVVLASQTGKDFES